MPACDGDVQNVSGESLVNLSRTSQKEMPRRNKIIMAAMNLRSLEIDESWPFSDEQRQISTPGSDRDMKSSPADPFNKTGAKLVMQEVFWIFAATATIFETGVLVHNKPLKSH